MTRYRFPLTRELSVIDQYLTIRSGMKGRDMPKLPMKISAEVSQALQNGTPVVGLESNVISNGLPYPTNLDLALACDELLRAKGVVPAVTFIDQGHAHVGATNSDLHRLSQESNVLKLTTRDLAYGLRSNQLGSTSVSASIRLCAEAGVPIFASAGLGGVHRDYSTTMDMSSDLYELSRQEVIVVSAGVKKFLDIPRTCEALESLNIPVMGFRTTVFPAFYCRDGGVKLSAHSREWTQIADIARCHLDSQIGGAFLVVAAPSDEIALDEKLVENAISDALSAATTQGVTGKDITKHVMRAIDDATEQRTRQANFDVMLEIVGHAADFALTYGRTP